jgi:hypothetical protein
MIFVLLFLAKSRHSPNYLRTTSGVGGALSSESTLPAWHTRQTTLPPLIVHLLSDVRVADTPNLDTQTMMKVSAKRVDLSTRVNRKRKPSAECGKWPREVLMDVTEPALWNRVVTLPLQHFWQSQHQDVMSLFLDFHSNRLEMRRRVALMSGWAM